VIAFDENSAPLGNPYGEGIVLELVEEIRDSMLKNGQGPDDSFKLLCIKHLACYLLNSKPSQSYLGLVMIQADIVEVQGPC
jgi:hypothetical protein